MIKCVLFDIDNTLYDFTTGNRLGLGAAAAYALEKFGMDRGDFDSSLRAASDSIISRLGTDNVATHSRIIRFEEMLDEKGLPVFPHAHELARLYWDTLIASMRPEPGLTALLSLLKMKGVRVGAATNMTSTVQHEKIIALGLSELMDFMVSSESAGFEKPRKEFFLECARRAGCLPEECAFVGDSERTDAAAAERAGMHGVWYKPLAGMATSKKSFAPAVVDEELAELPPAKYTIESFISCIEGDKACLGGLSIE